MKRLSQEKMIEIVKQLRKLKKLAEVLEFDIPDLYVENEPMIYTAYRSSSMSEEERNAAEHMFEMMMVSKQQLLLKKAMAHPTM